MPPVAEGSGSRRAFAFPASHRLRKSAEIKAVLDRGRRVSCKGLRLAFCPNGLDRPRMAIALKRGYGRAVDRNRAKRLIRESFRLFGPLQAPGYDMVFQAFPGDDIFSTRSAQVARLMLEAGFRPRPRP